MEVLNIAMICDGDYIAFVKPKTPLSEKEFHELCKNICERPELKKLQGRELVQELSRILIAEKNFTAVNVIAGYPKNSLPLKRLYFESYLG